AWYDMSARKPGELGVVGLTGTEYLELLAAAGYHPENYPVCQAKGQYQIWQRVSETATPKAIARAIAELKREDPNFRVAGVASAQALTWAKGNDPVLASMQKLSNLFHQKVAPLLTTEAANGHQSFSDLDQHSTITRQLSYRRALLYHLLLQTSCFHCWGQGMWTDYARILYSRGKENISNNF
ncbi:MAG TPA: glycosyl hydrolase family 57, partial [Allocoleopsis sp.]